MPMGQANLFHFLFSNKVIMLAVLLSTFIPADIKHRPGKGCDGYRVVMVINGVVVRMGERTFVYPQAKPYWLLTGRQREATS